MFATVRDTKGQGNSAVYARIRDVSGNFWNFITLAWVTPEVANCRIFLTEYADSDTLQSRYQAPLTPPAGDVIVEYVRLATFLVIAEESSLELKVDSLIASVARVLALSYDNINEDQQAYDGGKRLTSARARAYDTAANALAGGLTGLLYTYAIAAAYDGSGNCTSFTMTRNP